MKRILLCCLLFSLGACSSLNQKPATSESKEAQLASYETSPLVGKFQVHRYEFRNGLRLLVVQDPSAPTFAYQTWFRVGSRDEKPGRTGLAHLFEHMMFKETKNHKEGEYFRTLERAGADGVNAFTSHDFTAYIQNLPVSQLELIVQMESDRMVNLQVNDQSFKTEREVVQNERRMRNENNPNGLMEQELFELAFKKHPYHWPIIGYQEDLSRMSAEDARKFYQTYYSPNHATIVVVGDVEPTKVRNMIAHYYGGLTPNLSASESVQPEPLQDGLKRKQLKLNIQVEKLFLGYKIPEFTHNDFPAILVLQKLLVGGKSSRLTKALVDQGIASSVDSQEFEDKDPSLLILTVNLQKNRHASQAEKVIHEEMARLSKDLISEEELERAKNRLEFFLYESLGSSYRKAFILGAFEALAGDYRTGLDIFKRINSVTARQIQRIAAQYLNKNNLTIITGVPKK